MNRVLRWGLLGTAAFVLACAALAAAALVWGLPEQGLHIRIDGEDILFTLGHGGHWVWVTAGLFIAMIATLLVVPIVLVFSIGVPLLTVALMLSPLLLLGWLVFRSTRNTHNTKGPPSAATMRT